MFDPREVMSVRDWVLWGVLAALMILETLAVGGSWPDWLWLVPSVLAAGVVVGLRRTRPLIGFLVAALVTGSEIIESIVMSGPFRVVNIGLLVLAAYAAGRNLRTHRPFVVTVIAAQAALLITGLTVRGSVPLTTAILSWFWTLILTLLFVILPWLYGRYREQHARLVSEGWERAERTETEQRMAVEQARLRERNRIAQDMHDSLGHELSLIALRAGALEVDDALPERHRRSAAELRTAASTATARLGQIVGVLRADDSAPVAPAIGSVHQIADRARASGLDVQFEPSGEAPALSPLVEHALVRVVQECLTNATKHAPDTTVSVSIDYREETVAVVVRNTAPTDPAPVMPTGGYGLAGLEERLRVIGGDLTYGRSDGEYLVRASIPYDVDIASGRDPESPVPTAATEHQEVRDRARRGLLTAIAAPLAIGATVGLVMLAYYLVLGYASVLDESDYDQLRVGQSRAEAEVLLPSVEMVDQPDGPPTPDDVECQIYRSDGPFQGTFAYQVCFEDDVLVSKRKVQMGSVPIEEDDG